MSMFLTASRKRGVTAMLVLLAFVAGTHTARADYLVWTFAGTNPKSARHHRHRREIQVNPQVVRREPLTVYGPHQDATAPPDPEMTPAQLAIALQSLLICAIPPPMDTIIQTTTTTNQTTTNQTTTQQQQPGAPAPPQYILPDTTTDPGGGNSGVIHTADVPEPASLMTALVGTSLTGLALWQRKKKRRRRLAA
jgi:hypothetical protein